MILLSLLPIFELRDVEILSAIGDNDTKKTEKGYCLYGDIPADDTVVFSPSRQFGGPCIVGTRIPTDLVFTRHTAGETVDDIAWDLQGDTPLIAGAIEYEQELRIA